VIEENAHCSTQLTVWFPLRLYETVKIAVPVVDPFNELGHPRSASDMDREYQRLLDRDNGTFSFLYRGAVSPSP
jgi:hypothetical protein